MSEPAIIESLLSLKVILAYIFGSSLGLSSFLISLLASYIHKQRMHTIYVIENLDKLNMDFIHANEVGTLNTTIISIHHELEFYLNAGLMIQFGMLKTELERYKDISWHTDEEREQQKNTFLQLKAHFRQTLIYNLKFHPIDRLLLIRTDVKDYIKVHRLLNLERKKIKKYVKKF